MEDHDSIYSVGKSDLQGQWLLRSKFVPPSQDLVLIKRAALLELLDRASRSTLCLITAPAGFGKTTMLSQWRDHRLGKRDTVAWVTLDDADAEPHQFLAYVVTALDAAGLPMGGLGVGLAQGTTRGALEPAVHALLEVVTRFARPVYLILDDFHRAETPEVNAILLRMIADAPSNLSIALNSRTRPKLGIAQLLANGRASEVDVESLRFTEIETAAAFGHAASDERSRLLYERTAGWPVVVQLARLLFSEVRDGMIPLEKFNGSAGHIAAYLTDEVLSVFPEELQDFLIRTSLLERFNVDLANAVVGRTDSLQCMKQLEPLRALIVPLGDTEGWFRYHHLFTECLNDHLRRRYPLEVCGLHLRASAWFAEQGSVVDAVRHARAAGDYDRCADLIAKAGGWELITYGGIGYLRNLLQNLPTDRLHDYPRMQLARSYLEAKDGRVRAARALLDAAKAWPRASQDAGLARDITNVQSLIEDYEDPHVTLRSLKTLDEAISQVPAADALTRGTLTCQHVLVLIALGRLTEAEAAIERMMQAMRQAGSVLGVNYCFVHMALVAIYQGRFHSADAHLAIARRMADANFGADSGLRSLSDTLLGVLRLWQGRLEGDDLERFRLAADEVETHDGWLEIYANLLDAEAVIDPGEAIRRAERLVEARGLERLDLQSQAQKLLSAFREGRLLEAEGLSQLLRLRLPTGIWRTDPFYWRPFVESRLALAVMESRRDRAEALRMLDDAHECCNSTGAQLFRIEILALKADLLHQSGDRNAALAVLSDALYLAVPERICRPFLRNKGLVPMLRTLRRTGEGSLDILVSEFITDLLGRLRRINVDRADGMSEREREVLGQLADGLSNKEIARALDMTEHTVKFHLKNIFAKLKVERRSEAITQAHARDLVW